MSPPLGCKMKKWLLNKGVLFLLVGLSLGLSSQGVQRRTGKIEGRVLDLVGMPVANATVYVLENGRSPAATTAANGDFVIMNVGVGEHRVFAYKESENYPNPLWSFYEEARGLERFPVIYVNDNYSIPVVIKLGPKSGKLLMRVVDATTGKPVSGASVEMNHEGKPRTLFKPGPPSQMVRSRSWFRLASGWNCL
jgi:hypothetical protein